MEENQKKVDENHKKVEDNQKKMEQNFNEKIGLLDNKLDSLLQLFNSQFPTQPVPENEDQN